MVSTRGIKLRFVDGERVLCYEPDPTKAKVLYDSKVLRVVINKDQRGRKTVEYLIHFQGWNSSWDRCVSEDFVLKDTPENRQLQRDLAEKAQLQLGAYLYRRDKKRSRKLSDRINESLQQSSEDGSSGSPALMDTDDTQGATTTSDSDSSVDDDSVPLELTKTLRYWLEQDHIFITKKNKLVKLPAEPNVAMILEGYLKHYATCQMCGISEKKARNRNSLYGTTKPKNVDNVYKNLNVCKEMVDGIRIYFDFTLADLLLYNQEREQAQQLGLRSTLVKGEMSFSDIKNETEEFSHLPEVPAGNLFDDSMTSPPESLNGSRRTSNNALPSLNPPIVEESADNCTVPSPLSLRRRLRSCRVSQHSEVAQEGLTESSENGLGLDSIKQETYGNASSVASTTSDSSGPLSQVQSWKLLPDEVLSQNPQLPCLMYGAVHLTRLLVKLPELLWATNMPEDKLKLLLRHLDIFVDYLDEHREWYGEKHYVDIPTAES